MIRDLLRGLSTQPLSGTAKGDRVSLSEIESRLRSLGSSAQQVVSDSKQNAIAAALIGGAAVVASAYLHGRRRGRRRASVLEIRRS
jgi:hypothetical protein